jgi:hypothetical protein
MTPVGRNEIVELMPQGRWTSVGNGWQRMEQQGSQTVSAGQDEGGSLQDDLLSFLVAGVKAMDRDSITVAAGAWRAAAGPLARNSLGGLGAAAFAAMRSLESSSSSLFRLGHCLPAALRCALGVEFNVPAYGLLT